MTSTPSNKPIRHDLSRFHEAQEGRGEGSSFATALEEIRNGRKTSHWIWYVFPQLRLGTSSMSRKYAIADAEEARAYLSDNVLHDRLLLITQATLDQLKRGVRPTQLMGSTIDLEKLCSSMTLFDVVSDGFPDGAIHQTCSEVANFLEQQGLVPCTKTLMLLDKHPTRQEFEAQK